MHALKRASYNTFRYADDAGMAGEGEDGEEGRDKSGSVLSAVAPPGGSGSTDAGPMRPREASVDTGGGGAGGGLCSVPIIAPFTTRKLTWDLWVGLLIVYSALSIPFRIGFGVDTTPTWRALDLVTDFFFLLDIITNFHTAFVHPRTGVLVVSRSAIAAKYMRGWFPIDFASTFPFDLVVDLATGGSADNATLRSTRLLRILRLARLLKLMRLSRLSRLLGQLKSWNGHGASQTAFSLLRLTLYLTIVAHFIACFWYGVSSDTPADSAMVSWVVGAGLNQNTTLGLNYTVSLYWAFTSSVPPPPPPMLLPLSPQRHADTPTPCLLHQHDYCRLWGHLPRHRPGAGVHHRRPPRRRLRLRLHCGQRVPDAGADRHCAGRVSRQDGPADGLCGSRCPPAADTAPPVHAPFHWRSWQGACG